MPIPRQVTVPPDLEKTHRIISQELDGVEFSRPEDYPALCLRLLQDLTSRVLACEQSAVDELRRKHGLV